MERDYRKMYFETRAQCLNLEMSLMNLRAQMIEEEMPKVDAELKKYDSKEKDKS